MATDNNGYYVLSEISIKNPTLIVSYVGYSQYEQKLDFNNDQSLNIMVALSPEAIEIIQVDVTAEEIDRLNKIEPSKVTLSLAY